MAAMKESFSKWWEEWGERGCSEWNAEKVRLRWRELLSWVLDSQQGGSVIYGAPPSLSPDGHIFKLR